MDKLLIFSFTVVFIMIIALFICSKKVTKQETKDRIVKIFAILTVFFHYSSLWVDYFKTGTAEVGGAMLLPIYPCHICMWLLLVVSLMKNKETFMCKKIIEFLAIGGTVCGMIGLFANENFLSEPEFLNYDSLKGLLSHSTMIFATLFLLTQGYVKLRVINITVSTIIGLLIFVVDGAIVNGLFAIFELDSVNAMYMLEFPLDIPGFNFLTMGIAGVLVVFILMNVYELLFVEPSQRWFNKLKKEKNEIGE